jgi:hypothetical protein
MKTQSSFELLANGEVKKVGPFGSYGPIVTASTKSEAIAFFLSYAHRSANNSPTVKVRNGAWQLTYEALSNGVCVEAGLENRPFPVCIGGANSRKEVTDQTASFAYYASEEYRQNVA